MAQDEDLKKLSRLLERGDSLRKAPKDIMTSILLKISTQPTNDVKKEYFEILKECKLMKTALMQCLNNGTIKSNQELKNEGEILLKKITAKLSEEIEPLKPVIIKDSSANQKFRFRDGSESIIENYNQVKDTVLENQLLNRINILENLCSDALGYVARVEKQLWQREDGIEEIDLTKKTEKNETEPKKNEFKGIEEIERVIDNGGRTG